ncbi:hypothetical protein, partial [Oceanivirga salmonicida]|uniref:hypothetical protein n=1 Tax=Oceanivirga salmonicida TaxID=1769291 RepID=UPI0018CC0318
KEYIINELLYDKSKGNHFEKIDEYIQKNKERIFKIFLNDDWKNGEAVKFKLDVLRNIDFNKKNHKFYFRKNRNANIKNYAIIPIREDNSKEYVELQEREKQFFNEEIKYEDIDWGKYIEHMGDYPVLIMYVEERIPDDSEEGYHIYDSDIREREIEYTPEKVKALKELYKEFEKYYNKDTF